jgi:hypothetical protein
MHKLVFTFGLLASSLVMLSIMPVLTQQQNSFSNTALAQEYDKYGDSYYSTYQTDDKKYECRTGPFEGFFVSSVEFCKHIKFDDKRKDFRDNKTGIQGPPGPPGATGATGPQGIQGLQGIPGPAGITQLNSSNVYQVISNVTEILNNTGRTVTVLCDPGDIVINGGYIIQASDVFDSIINVLRNQPFGALGAEPNNGWQVFLVSGTTAQLTVIANCFDNPPLRP